MAGWKDFAFEWRKRDTAYPEVTANHIAIYADTADTLYTVSGTGTPANHHMGHLEVVNGATSWRGTVYNEAWGTDALLNNMGEGNTAVGHGGLRENTTGYYNTAVGFVSIANNTTGKFNTALGAYSLLDSSTADNNTAIGYGSLQTSTTGSDNVAVGFQSMFYNKTGNYNVAVGAGALINTDSSNNTAVGFSALSNNISGNNNTAIGDSALFNCISGSNNVAIGAWAGYNEQGSNKLYIDSTTTSMGTSADALIYGEFDNKYLRLGGDVDVAGDLTSNGNSAITRVPVPSTNSSPGVPNTIAIDTTHLYVCIGVDSWKRISLSSF